MEPMAVLTLHQTLETEPVLEHVGRAPLRRHRDVITEMPPEVVTEILRSALNLPLAEHVETLMVEQEESARTAAAGRPHGAGIDRVGTAVNRMHPTVPCA